MMTLRRFSQERLELCALWFDTVETADVWTDLGPIGEGESQSIRVEHAQTKIVGVAKPGPGVAANDTCRAAHEKLAFDLAHVVDLPVPPVVLWGDGLGAPYVRGRCISAWAYSQSKKWNEAQGLGMLTPAVAASGLEVVAAMRIFHAWIHDTDRKSDHTQVNLDSAPDALGVAFIDHAFSMSHVWKVDNVPGQPCPLYIPGADDHAIMAEVAKRIADIPDAEIERLVNRIPVGYLPLLERGHIIANLKARKGNLGALFGL